jgi:iron complex transport system ATP-binding protein
MSAPLLRVTDLTVAVPPASRATGLRPQRTLVQGLNLSAEAGQFWCLLGPNGAGKTQLLHTLAGARLPTAGEVHLGGKLLADWPLVEQACWRGLVPQAVHDAFSASVLEVVLQGRHPHLSRWQWEGVSEHAIAMAALERVGLGALAERDVTTLSGGERQRVALATVLTQDPPLLLLDEPLAHLDLAQQQRMLSLLSQEVKERQRCVLMSVHDLSLAQRVTTHVLLIQGAGRVLAGPVAEVMTEPLLSAAFGHRLTRLEAQGQIWWLPT